jgi:hypothetical protein
MKLIIMNYFQYNFTSMLDESLVTTAWRVLRLRMEGKPPDAGVAANILNKQ